jgi:hypothetical protein
MLAKQDHCKVMLFMFNYVRTFVLPNRVDGRDKPGHDDRMLARQSAERAARA